MGMKDIFHFVLSYEYPEHKTSEVPLWATPGMVISLCSVFQPLSFAPMIKTRRLELGENQKPWNATLAPRVPPRPDVPEPWWQGTGAEGKWRALWRTRGEKGKGIAKAKCSRFALDPTSDSSLSNLWKLSHVAGLEEHKGLKWYMCEFMSMASNSFPGSSTDHTLKTWSAWKEHWVLTIM